MRVLRALFASSRPISWVNTAYPFAAAYILTALQRVLLGPLNERWRNLPDMTVRELATLVPLLGLTLLVGVYPLCLMQLQDASLQQLLLHVKGP